MLFDNFPWKVISTRKDSSGHWIICIFEVNNKFLILGNLYGNNILNQNKQLIIEMTNVLTELSEKYINCEMILGGDCNMVMGEWLNRRIKNPESQIFTWFKPDGTIKSRLDYWLI